MTWFSLPRWLKSAETGSSADKEKPVNAYFPGPRVDLSTLFLSDDDPATQANDILRFHRCMNIVAQYEYQLRDLNSNRNKVIPKSKELIMKNIEKMEKRSELFQNQIDEIDRKAAEEDVFLAQRLSVLERSLEEFEGRMEMYRASIASYDKILERSLAVIDFLTPIMVEFKKWNLAWVGQALKDGTYSDYSNRNCGCANCDLIYPLILNIDTISSNGVAWNGHFQEDDRDDRIPENVTILRHRYYYDLKMWIHEERLALKDGKLMPCRVIQLDEKRPFGCSGLENGDSITLFPLSTVLLRIGGTNANEPGRQDSSMEIFFSVDKDLKLSTGITDETGKRWNLDSLVQTVPLFDLLTNKVIDYRNEVPGGEAPSASTLKAFDESESGEDEES